MNRFNEIYENREINRWVKRFSRSPLQLNRPHGSDAEIIGFFDSGPPYLACTIDTLSEEITRGIYRNPETMGWMLVMSSFSDLAAVGADPLGIVIAVSIERKRDKAFHMGIARGAESACRELGVFILGGDLNIAPNLSLTGCAFGRIPERQPLTRTGCRPGDKVFLSGPAGRGNALGLVRLMNLPEQLFPEKVFRPRARLDLRRILSRHASSCMDTSDGLLNTLDQLVRINGLGASFETDWPKILDQSVLQMFRQIKVPEWFAAAGILGEYELVFTISPEKMEPFLTAAGGSGFFPILLGEVEDIPGLRREESKDRSGEINIAALRNLWSREDLNPHDYLRAYLNWGKEWGFQ